MKKVTFEEKLIEMIEEAPEKALQAQLTLRSGAQLLGALRSSGGEYLEMQVAFMQGDSPMTMSGMVRPEEIAAVFTPDQGALDKIQESARKSGLVLPGRRH